MSADRWVLVPVEPTPEMVQAAITAWVHAAPLRARDDAGTRAWKAALAAAPAAPEPQIDGWPLYSGLPPAAPAAEPVGWISVDDRMPKSGQTVLACYTNRAGNVRRIRAEWVAAKSREATSDDSDIGVYDEATDTFYDPEGWYERIDNWGDYSSVVVTEGEVTHWMPLPAAPGSAPAQSRELLTMLTDEQIEALNHIELDRECYEVFSVNKRSVRDFAHDVIAEFCKINGIGGQS